MTTKHTKQTPDSAPGSLVSQLADFFRHGKRFWIGGIVAAVILLLVVILFTESSTLAPFIYSIF